VHSLYEYHLFSAKICVQIKLSLFLWVLMLLNLFMNIVRSAQYELSKYLRHAMVFHLYVTWHCVRFRVSMLPAISSAALYRDALRTIATIFFVHCNICHVIS
jgi:hypothetical protein